MKTIWKFPLLHMDSQTVVAPGGAKFLSVIEQGGAPMLYALVDTEVPPESIEVQVRGTGHPIDEALLESHIFLGTVMTPGINLVWHIFIPRNDAERLMTIEEAMGLLGHKIRDT